MLIVLAIVFAAGGLHSRTARECLGRASWACVGVALLTLYGITL